MKKKKVTAEIFFTHWVQERQTKEFDSVPEFEKFITSLKKLKDRLDCTANGVKKLWARKGTCPDGKTPFFVTTVYKNKSDAVLKYSATIK